MSSATTPTTFDQPAALTFSSSKNIFRLKYAAQLVFGCLLLLDSLYLIICYVTFDFYGALTSPFFAWLRSDAQVARVLYFPLFAAAVLASDLGLTGRQKQWAQRLAAVFLVLQVVAGFLFYFSPGILADLGWVLLYGPNLRIPAGNIVTYCESLGCLAPLAWLSLVHIVTSYRATSRKSISNRTTLSSFLAAALAASLLYQFEAKFRIAAGGEPFSFAALGFSVAAHIVIFAAVFLLLQWIHVIANRFSDPGLAHFSLRCICAWVLLAGAIRKIIFSPLAFNGHLADWYAALFSLALVLFVAALVLKIREQRASTVEQKPAARPRLSAWPARSVGVAAILVLFYFCAVKLVPIDWAHVMGSTGALAVWVLLMWFGIAIRGAVRPCSVKVLVVLTGIVAIGIGGVKTGVSSTRLGGLLEQYATYDPSLFVIQNSFKPAMEDEKYGAWYDFLARHGGIRVPVTAPEVSLTEKLEPTRGEKPNIFIFVIDALRRDYVSAYNPAVTFTPNIQEFAKDSVVFENAYSPYAGTALADPAIFSGFQQINKIFPKPLTRENNLQPMLNVDNYDCYISFNSIVANLSSGFQGIKKLETDRSDQLDFGPILQELESDLLNRKDPRRPIFAFAQPTNVHTLFLAWHGGKASVTPHPGFDDEYASAVQRVDASFGEFLDFLKKHGLYENSIVMVTADHGESLGEMGRESHVSNVTPEVIRVPLVIHLPQREKAKMVWHAEEFVSLHDITPTLYYLLGHRPIKSGEMVGRPLFTLTEQEQSRPGGDHFLMSSYGAIFGILSGDQKSIFMVDAVARKNWYFDLQTDPKAFKNRITLPIRDSYEPVIRHHLEEIDKFYGVSEQDLQQ
jgi:hypothetical protein